jgi:hypothetical protein
MTITINFKGRLGNQLYQYAALRAISIEKKYKMYIDTSFAWDEQPCLLNKFNIKNDKCCTNFKRVLKEDTNNKSLEYISNKIKDFDILQGSFSDYHYFKKYKNIIKQDFILTENITNTTKDYIFKIKSENSKKEIISINIRRGDFVKWNLFNDNYIINFINQALSKIDNIKDKILLIFIGGSIGTNSVHDISWVKSNLKYNNMIISPYSIKYDYESILYDMAISQCCEYMIIPIMSTINWWILFLNNNNPNNCFIPLNSHFNGESITYDDSYNIIDIPFTIDIRGHECVEMPTNINSKGMLKNIANKTQ